MKIRKGFVSNSSSSSFIIGLKEIPSHVDDIHKLLFNTMEPLMVSYYDSSIDSYIVAHQIFKDLQNPTILNTDDEVLEEIQSGCWETYPDLQYNRNSKVNLIINECWQKFKAHPCSFYDVVNLEKQDIHQRWKTAQDEEDKEYQQIVEKSAKKYWEKNKKKFDDLKKVVLEYSDNDGELSTILEHGDIFNLLPYICISKH